MANIIIRGLKLIWFSLSQSVSYPLKIYSLFVIGWTILWGSLWSWIFFIVLWAATSSFLGNLFINVMAWLFTMLLFCGPFWPFQLYWARRTKRIAGDADYWSKLYAIKAQEQQRQRYNEEMEKRRLQSQIQQYQGYHQVQPAPQYPMAPPAYPGYQYQQPAFPVQQPIIQTEQAVNHYQQAYQQKEIELRQAEHTHKAVQQELTQVQLEAKTEKEKRAAVEKEAEELKRRLDQIVENERKKDLDKANNIQMAKNYELALRYEDSAKIYEEYGMWAEAGRVRMKAIELHAPKSFFKAHNIQIGDSTIIQDSVVNRSEIGPK